MKLSVYGRTLEVIKSDRGWTVYVLGADGKKRISHDIFIPSHIREKEITTYLEDLLHEWASPGNDRVEKLD